MKAQGPTTTPAGSAEELLQRIAVCFADVRRPTRITKTVARATDDEWHLPESRRALLYSQDPETSWDQLADDEMEKYFDVFPFLEAEGYLFYLPAFMSHVLRMYPRVTGGNAVDFTIYACMHSCESFRLFDSEQMRCVVDFLTLCAAVENFCDSHSAAQAADLMESCPNAPSDMRRTA